MNKIACIASLDGLDNCVAENTKKSYRDLGFVTIVGTGIVGADILVLLRGGISKTIDCSCYQTVHVYNYVGQDNSQIILENVKHLVLIEHQVSLEPLRPKADRRPDAVIRARHAVFPQLWQQEPRQIRCLVSHVGNYKQLTTCGALDAPQQELINHMNGVGADVWGRGWQTILSSAKIHRAVSLWAVPRIFASANVTLGLRYPYQRQHDLISSRYWLAPLTGCPVVSAEPALHQDVPGVMFASYDNCGSFRLGHNDRRLLAKRTASYWSDLTDSLQSQLRENMRSIQHETPYRFGHAKIWFQHEINMFLRRTKSRIERD